MATGKRGVAILGIFVADLAFRRTLTSASFQAVSYGRKTIARFGARMHGGR
jgi:hypothetical protein